MDCHGLTGHWHVAERHICRDQIKTVGRPCNQPGYPVYFLTILGVWKILGVIAILAPRFKLLKEWAYAGFFFAMTGALASHLFAHDYEIRSILGPSFQALFVVISWYFRPENRKVVEVNE